MKIRMGFVSNSSSSSFIIATTKENHETALSQMTEREQEIINELTGEEKFLGKILKYYGEVIGRDEDYEYDNKKEEALDKWKELIKKNEDAVFSVRMG
jgi:hypothetical protein